MRSLLRARFLAVVSAHRIPGAAKTDSFGAPFIQIHHASAFTTDRFVRIPHAVRIGHKLTTAEQTEILLFACRTESKPVKRRTAA